MTHRTQDSRKGTRRHKDRTPAYSHPSEASYVKSLFLSKPLPRPTFPYIRSLVPNPLPSGVLFYDRSYTEWMTLIDSWRRTLSWSLTSHYAPALETAFYASQRMRFLARVYLRKLRMRVATRRCPPQDDLNTCAPVPEGARVTVYDFPHRSVYTFHWKTLLRMCLTSLSFSQYGIAQPMAPKNPHTNLPWTVGQQVSIVHQLAVCSLNRHTFLPQAMMWYREVRYSIPAFYHKHYDSLNLCAAHSFFSRPADPDVRIIYQELADDLYNDLEVIEPAVRGGVIVRERVKARSLSDELMVAWDSLLVSMWILENHHRPHNEYTSYHQLFLAAVGLHTRSWLWCTTRERQGQQGQQGPRPLVRRVRRVVAPARNPPPE